MGNPIGLQVVERRSSGTPVLTPGQVGNVAMVVKSPLGPEDKVIQISSLDQFRTIFGGPNVSFQSYYEAKGLFENAAPFNVNVYCIRAAETAGTASSHQLGSGGNTLTIERGYLGTVSPGAEGDDAKFELSAELSGTFTLRIYNLDDDGNEVLVETISGITSSNVEGKINDRSKFAKATLTGSYTLGEVTAEVLGTGDAAETNFTGNLDNPPIIPGTLEVTDGTETFTDEGDGTLTGDAGGSGTIDYSTGAYDITFNSAPASAQDITGDYQGSIAKVALSNGADPTYPANISSDELSLYDNENIQLLFAPDYTTQTDASNLEGYAAGKGNVLAIASAPLSETPGTLNGNFSSTLLKAKSFLAGYFNWMKVDDLLGGSGLYTPALGHVIGAYYIRKMRQNSNFAFTPPAGLQISLRGIQEQNQTLTAGQIERVAHDYGLNVIQFYRGYGFVVRTSRTMSTLDKHYSIHIRRSLNYLINSFNAQLGIFEQRQNNVDTRRQLASTLTNFLFREYQNGMFETVGGFDANVGVICDETNNDQQTRNARELVADTALNFAEVAETVYINIRKSEGQVNVDVG